MSALATRRSQHLTLRVTEHELAEINALADKQGVDRTQYMVAAALGRLDSIGLEGRISRAEQRLQRLEQLAYTG